MTRDEAAELGRGPSRTPVLGSCVLREKAVAGHSKVPVERGPGVREGWVWPRPEMVLTSQEPWGQEGGTESTDLRKVVSIYLGVGGDYLNFLICEMGILPTSCDCTGEDRTNQCVVHVEVL